MDNLKEYSKPKLLNHGSVKKLTWGTSGTRRESKSGHKKK